MAGEAQGQVRERREVITTNAFMKIPFHTITALLLLSHSVIAGPLLKVRTEKQRAVIQAQVQPHTELRVFIGDESLGWSARGRRPELRSAPLAPARASAEDG